MTGLLQCDDLMQFQRLLKRNVWFNTFDVLFDFRALKQLRAIDDKIIYALNVSTPTASMQVVNYIDAPFNISYFASILSGSRSWSETKMLGIENWARTKLQGLYILTGCTDWLLALPQVREEHIRNCVSVMEDKVRIVPEKMIWLWSEDLISNWIYFFSRRNVVFLSLHFLFFVFFFVLFFVLHWSSGERKESRSSRATSGSSQGKFLHSLACKTLTRVYSLF